MKRAINDATLNKLGDIFQYYIALKDCFSLNNGDKMQIEINGDVSVIAIDKNKSIQKEVKHHVGNNNLRNRDIDFWKTISNWYVDFKRTEVFDKLILYTTANIKSDSLFRDWNKKSEKDKLKILRLIGSEVKEKEAEFRKHYNRIFDSNIYEEDKLLSILKKIVIESSVNKITDIEKDFNPYIGHIPLDNREKYISALLGRILSKVAAYPHRWEFTRIEFEAMLQEETVAYGKAGFSPLPDEFANVKLTKEIEANLLNKKFVKAIKDISYEKVIPNAISDYWKTDMTLIKYFRDDFLYLKSLEIYSDELEEKLIYTKEASLIDCENASAEDIVKNSKKLYMEVMKWNTIDFGSIIRNRGYFQRGIIHNIVDEEKFIWNLGANNEH